MAQRKKPAPHQTESYEEKAEQILLLASSLPQGYRDKLLQDLKQMNKNGVQHELQNDRISAPDHRSIQHEHGVSFSGETRRRSQRTSKKTSKLVEFMKTVVKIETPEDPPTTGPENLLKGQARVQLQEYTTTKRQELINNDGSPGSTSTGSLSDGHSDQKLHDHDDPSQSSAHQPDKQNSRKRKRNPKPADISHGAPRRRTRKKTDPEQHIGKAKKDVHDVPERMSASVHCDQECTPDIVENCQSVDFLEVKSEKSAEERESANVVACFHIKSESAPMDKVVLDPDPEEEAPTQTITIGSDINAYPSEIIVQEADTLFFDALPDNDEHQPKEIEACENIPVSDPVDHLPDVVPRRKRKPKGPSMPSSHTCPECQQEWPTRDSLRAHIAKKHKGNFKCETCGQIFRYRHTYKKHVSSHDSGDFHKCPHCANMIKGKDRLQAHIQQMHVQTSNCKKRYHSCFECDEQFRSVKKLASHTLNVHGRHAFQCELCGRRYLYSAPFRQHMLEHEQKLLTKCDYDLCTFYFKTDTEYMSHVARVHEKNAPRPYMCDICSHSFTEPRYLRSHMKSHEKEKKFVCETCMFEARTVQSLKNHLERKHSMTLAHVCELCGAKLSSKAGLEQHVKRHYNQRDCECPDCGKYYVTKGQLAAHRKTHTDRGFECDICAKGFINKFKLASHMVTHSKEKNFECNHCSYRCNLKSNLYKHTERVHRVVHPDKFSSYRYVQKVQHESDSKPMVEMLQLVDVAPKLAVSEGDHQEQEWTSYEEPGTHTAVAEQTEAAHVLAQMQTGQLTIQEELGAGPEADQGLVHSTNTGDQVVGNEYVEGDARQTMSAEEVVVDNIDSVYHVVEEGLVEEEEPEDAMYVLQLEGMSDTLAVRASDMDALASGSVISVNDGTVLMIDTGSPNLQS